jgi:peptidoglycan/LPS O-acetylase OafA/YrhL
MNQRNLGIDLTRCLAITGVILIHTQIFGYGHFGVQLFFTISGYLLANIKRESAIQFIIHRFFRLFPLYIIFLILGFETSFKDIKDSLPAILMFQNAWYSFSSFPGGWSISSEWIFSLLLIFFLSISKRRLQIVMVAISFISFLLALYVFSKGGINNSAHNTNFSLFRWLNTWNPVINLNFFLIGLGLRKEYLYIIKSKFILWILLVSCILFDLFIGNLLVLQQIAIYSIFVICLTAKFPDYKMLKYSISFIGKRTYGIFFGHFYVYARVEDLVDGFGNTSSFFIKLLEFLIVLAISVGIGAITWRLIELPGIKLGEKFYLRLSRQN